MLLEMRPSELGAWAALWGINPWGEDRADLRSAIVASIVANANRDTKRRTEPFTPLDFMPFREENKAEKSKALSRKARAALMELSGKRKK